MKRFFVVLLGIIVTFVTSACESASAEKNVASQPLPSATGEQVEEQNGATDRSSSSPVNASGVKYEDVSSFIQNALSDMGVQEKPQNISIESFETSGDTHATVNFQAEGKQLSAGCFKDSEDKNWRLVDIMGSEDDGKKCYWLNDLVKGKEDLYDFKTGELISKKSE